MLGPADDISGAVLLLQRLFREEGFDTPDDAIAANARKMTGIEACGLFVAEDRAAAIGIATVSLEFGIEYGWSAEMGDLYVVPEWRGRGLCGRDCRRDRGVSEGARRPRLSDRHIVDQPGLAQPRRG
jgi:hypothetical protein